MVGEAIAGLTIFKSMMDTARGLKDIHDATIRDQAAFMLQRQILEAQMEQMALVDDVGRLKEELAKFETWDAEKQRYQLEEIAAGVSAYRIKEAVRDGEPEHYICANCYSRRVKSILQAESWQPMRCRVLVCHTCGSVLYQQGQPHPDHKSLKPRGAS